jgi:hypothetical protein
VQRWSRNADEGLRALERAAAQGDPEAANRLMVEKIRAGRAADITLGELALANHEVANEVSSTLPPGFVRELVRAALYQGHGHFVGTEVEAGMVDAFARIGDHRAGMRSAGWYRPGLPPRVATPEVVRELIELRKAGRLQILDFYVPSWIFLLPQSVASDKWGPILNLRRARGWLEEELGAVQYTGLIAAEEAQDAHAASLAGYWLLTDPWQFHLEESLGE